MAYRQNFYGNIDNLVQRLQKLEFVSQKLGADVIQVTSSNISSAASGSVSAGGKVIYTITLTPSAQILTIWDLLFSIFIDEDFDTDYLYPNGSSLSAGDKNLDLQFSVDWALSDDSVGKRIAIITIVNNDSSPHEYFLYSKWYGPKQTI